jgi:hypothetical protein
LLEDEQTSENGERPEPGATLPNAPLADVGEAAQTRPGRAFISDGVGLTLLEEVPWGNRRLKALLSVALADEHLVGEGAFAVLRSRQGEGYTARRIRSLAPNMAVLLRITLCDGRWIAIGPPGTEPHEVFADGHARPWDGPVPVEALS